MASSSSDGGLFSSFLHQDCRAELQQCQEKPRLTEKEVGDGHMIMVSMRKTHEQKMSAASRKFWIDSEDRVQRALIANIEELAKDHKRQLEGLRLAVRQDLEDELRTANQAKSDRILQKSLREGEKDNERKINARLQTAKLEHEKGMNKRLQAMKREHNAQMLAQKASYNALEEKLHKAKQLTMMLTNSVTSSRDMPSDNDSEVIAQLKKDKAALEHSLRSIQAAKFKALR